MNEKEEKGYELDEIDSLFEQETLYRQSRLIAHISLKQQFIFEINKKKGANQQNFSPDKDVIGNSSKLILG